MIGIIVHCRYSDYSLVCGVQLHPDDNVRYELEWVVDGTVVQSNILNGSFINQTVIDWELKKDVLDKLDIIEEVRNHIMKILYYMNNHLLHVLVSVLFSRGPTRYKLSFEALSNHLSFAGTFPPRMFKNRVSC